MEHDAEMNFSEYIVYVDESGDHGVNSVDPNYPLFVLACCVFKKNAYINRLVPAFQSFKFDYFGHDGVVFHESDLRKKLGPFKILLDPDTREVFMDQLTGRIEQTPFSVIAAVIRKDLLKQQGDEPANLYHLALGFCLETLHGFLDREGQLDATTHVVCEARGKKEDTELELEFRRICDGQNRAGVCLPFDIVIADKRVNSCGLQIADLIARPIGISVVRPDQPNRAYDIIAGKFCDDGNGDIQGHGLRVFPEPRKTDGPDEAPEPSADQDIPDPQQHCATTPLRRQP